MKILALLLLLTSCRPTDPPPTESPPVRPALTRAQEIGRRIYLRRCAACHGEQGDGAGRNSPNLSKPAEFPPSLIASAVAGWLRGQRPRPGLECPDWKDTFSEAERRAVADYVLTLLKR